MDWQLRIPPDVWAHHLVPALIAPAFVSTIGRIELSHKNGELIWKTVKEINYLDSVASKIERCDPVVLRLNVKTASPTWASLSAFSRLEVLECRFNQVEHEAFARFPSNIRATLRTVVLGGEVGVGILRTLANCCPHLKILDLQNCDFSEGFDYPTPSLGRSLGWQLPKLKVLMLPRNFPLQKDVLTLGKFVEGISSLRLLKFATGARTGAGFVYYDHRPDELYNYFAETGILSLPARVKWLFDDDTTRDNQLFHLLFAERFSDPHKLAKRPGLSPDLPKSVQRYIGKPTFTFPVPLFFSRRGLSDWTHYSLVICSYFGFDLFMPPSRGLCFALAALEATQYNPNFPQWYFDLLTRQLAVYQRRQQKYDLRELLRCTGHKSNRDTALHLAAHKQFRFAAVLLPRLVSEFQQDVNAQNEEGQTPLHHSLGALEVVRALLACGGDIALRNKAGMTPVQFWCTTPLHAYRSRPCNLVAIAEHFPSWITAKEVVHLIRCVELDQLKTTLNGLRKTLPNFQQALFDARRTLVLANASLDSKLELVNSLVEGSDDEADEEVSHSDDPSATSGLNLRVNAFSLLADE